MFYEGHRLNNLKKQSQIALHNATQIPKVVYPTPEQFHSRLKFSFVRYCAPHFIELCNNDAEQLISDLNEYSKDDMMPLINTYIEEYAPNNCAETLYQDIKQASAPIA
jgi:hypothetical protein